MCVHTVVKPEDRICLLYKWVYTAFLFGAAEYTTLPWLSKLYNISIEPVSISSALQSQNAVSPYLWNEEILPFGIARQICL